jgi:hypothetical protein
MFVDISKELYLPYRTSEGKIRLGVRYPSDNQWIERGRLTRVVSKKAGRGETQNEVFPNSEADLKLYHELKIEDAPDLTPEEATRLFDALGFCEVRDTQLGSHDATVIMGAMGGIEVVHTIPIPTAEQTLKFRKQVQRGGRELPNGKSEFRVMIEPGAALWDACRGTSKDYAGAIPAIHKNLAMRTVIEELDRELQAGMGEDSDAF